MNRDFCSQTDICITCIYSTFVYIALFFFLIINNYTHGVHVSFDLVKNDLGAKLRKRLYLRGSFVFYFVMGQNRNFLKHRRPKLLLSLLKTI